MHVSICETHIQRRGRGSVHLFPSNKFNLMLPQQSLMLSNAFSAAICDSAARFPSDVLPAQPNTERERRSAEKMSADLIRLGDELPPGGQKQRAGPAVCQLICGSQSSSDAEHLTTGPQPPRWCLRPVHRARGRSHDLSHSPV